MPYQLPDDDIVSIIDAPLAPLVLLAPGGGFALAVRYQAHPPVAELARHYVSLAGLRIDPVVGSRQRIRRLSGLSVVSLPDGKEREIELPAGAPLAMPLWAPDGRKFVFCVDESDGIGVWVGDAVAAAISQVPGLRVCDIIGGDATTVRWSRDSSALLALAAVPGPSGSGERATSGALAAQRPIEPQLDETAGKRSQMASYQDLLRTRADEDAFEALATTVPVQLDLASGVARELGPPGLYQQLSQSPDGQHLLVHRLLRPFSFRVPFNFFSRRVEVWSAAGDPEAVIADLQVSDEVPRQGVAIGPRGVSWAEAEPATLLWVEALDGGDPLAEAEHRDQMMRLAPPFAPLPTEPVLALRHRCVGWFDLPEPGQLLVMEHDRDRRWLTTYLSDLNDGGASRVVFDHSADESYADPGMPMMPLRPDGTRVVLQDGPTIYMRGDGAGPDGDRPFLDAFNLDTGESSRLFQSTADAYEMTVGFTGGGRDRLLVWRETPTTPSNLFLADLADLAGSGSTQLTSWPHPHPQLIGLEKRLVSHDRGDGVMLTGLLYLPPGYEQERDGALPLVVWSYPVDYSDAATAGQVRGSLQRFARLLPGDPTWFVLRGYAVLANAAMPVIGDPETMNDTFVEQITAAARAHIDALAQQGIIDPGRVAVGGHSYGAYMTANLLAHTDLFTAGIARSGAYNRTLTPFGFQSERRTFWEVPEVYDRLSPFRYADKIDKPILLIHGAQDANAGTQPVQSERLFQAVQGNGGTARLVLLPHENHIYMGRESVLHMLAEEFNWLERWLGRGPS